ncbi:hypothetical protein P3342_004879 [Pyrenophora teres f. teres]|nr:hypothetical protein P3342_004879 [Pyrenophora teres f. teres]
MATRILRLSNDHDPLGQRWLQSFIARQPRVSSIIGRSIEVARADAASPAVIRAFLELFERTRIELNIKLDDIWNMDETGVALGELGSGYRLLSRYQPPGENSGVW